MNTSQQLRLSPFLLIFLFHFSTNGFTQNPELLDFNKMRLKKTQTAMTILGGWSVINISTGLALQSGASGEDKYFHQMNAIWNGINLAIAGAGYLGARKTDPSSFSFAQTVKEQHKFQKILLFNAGLDVGYMAGGLYLMERSKQEAIGKGRDQMKGWGKSILLQGGFLFLFDVVTAWGLSRDNSKLEKWLSTVSFTGNSLGLSLEF